MSGLKVESIEVAYDGKPVVFDVGFQLDDGRIGCLLGPSGCGKTTVLRAIAGFERPVQGRVAINGETVSDEHGFLPPEQRNIGMVFQDYALFPHLTVADNIRFGIKKRPVAERKRRIAEMLELIDLADLADAYPHQLSGGQQQRVAVARALAPHPSILLLDEPFSSMDTELREQLARDVRKILKQEHVTAILVTHDQHEAFAMADEICVMNEGRIQQHDTAFNLYHRPVNRFVADFIGEGVIVTGKVKDAECVQTQFGDIPGKVPKGCKAGCPVDVLVRPDDIQFDAHGGYTVDVVDKAFRGSSFLYTLRMPGGEEMLGLLPSHYNFEIGESMSVKLDLQHLVVYPRESG